MLVVVQSFFWWWLLVVVVAPVLAVVAHGCWLWLPLLPLLVELTFGVGGCPYPLVEERQLVVVAVIASFSVGARCLFHPWWWWLPLLSSLEVVIARVSFTVGGRRPSFVVVAALPLPSCGGSGCPAPFLVGGCPSLHWW